MDDEAESERRRNFSTRRTGLQEGTEKRAHGFVRCGFLVYLQTRKVLQDNITLANYVDCSPRIPVYFRLVCPAVLGGPPRSYDNYSEVHLPLAVACPPALHEPP